MATLQLLSLLFTLFYTLAAASLSMAASSSLSDVTTPITIFAPTDSSLHTCPSCSIPLILHKHTVPRFYPLQLLRNLAFATKIQTLVSNRCFTVTSTTNIIDESEKKRAFAGKSVKVFYEKSNIKLNRMVEVDSRYVYNGYTVEIGDRKVITITTSCPFAMFSLSSPSAFTRSNCSPAAPADLFSAGTSVTPCSLRFCGLRRKSFRVNSFTSFNSTRFVASPKQLRSNIVSASLSGNGSLSSEFDYDLVIIGAGVGGHGALIVGLFVDEPKQACTETMKIVQICISSSCLILRLLLKEEYGYKCDRQQSAIIVTAKSGNHRHRLSLRLSLGFLLQLDCEVLIMPTDTPPPLHRYQFAYQLFDSRLVRRNHKALINN